MLTPEEIAALADAAAAVAVPMEEYLIKDIARRIAGAGQLTSTAAYQIYRAKQLGLSRKQIRDMLRKELKVSHKELRKLLEQSAEVGYNFDIRHLSCEAVPFAENASMQQMVAAAVKLAKRDFTNLTQTLGMVAPDGKAYPLQKAYQKTMDYAFEQVFTGATDYNTAIRTACKNIADMGVRVIDYESGVHTGLEAAVRRNIMGGLGLMQEQISQHNHEQFGADGWEISAHGGSAPDHEPIQGRQYSDKDYARLNGSLKRRIGTLNCGHAAFPIILGVNEPQYSEDVLQELASANAEGVSYQGRHYTLYEASQKQRQVERAIRKQKNRILAAESTDDKERLLVSRIRLVRLNDEYLRFSKATGQRTQRERTFVAGLGKGQAERAGGEYRKAKELDEVGTKPILITQEAVDRVNRVESSIIPPGILQEWHRDLLREAQKYPLDTEVMRSYAMDGRLLLQREGAGGTVRLKTFSETFFAIHNHPDTNTFSAGDIRAFAFIDNLRGISAVGNDGTIYLAEKLQSYDGTVFKLQYTNWLDGIDFATITAAEFVGKIESFLKGAEKYGIRYTTGR